MVGLTMPDEWLTYAQIGERFGLSPRPLVCVCDGMDGAPSRATTDAPLP